MADFDMSYMIKNQLLLKRIKAVGIFKAALE